MKDILNIVINYENEYEVLEYAKLLSEQKSSSTISLVIVVNKHSSLSSSSFKELFKNIELDVHFAYPPKNLGYLNGLLFGYNYYRKNIKNKPEWVVMSNTDISFASNDFFKKFLKKNYDNDIWCIAPSVFSPQKKVYENPQYVKRFTLKSLQRRILIFEHPLLANIYIKLAKYKAKFKKSEKKPNQHVYSAHGSFFILRFNFAEYLRTKEYGALMYSEEAYIAENLIEKKKKCYYDGDIEVFHHEGAVTGKVNIFKKARYYADSLKVIRDEFFNSERKSGK